jgi:regulator of protease activity HflC (stomatin/prohibitin superfamily)
MSEFDPNQPQSPQVSEPSNTPAQRVQGEETDQALDPGQQALSDALRVSFFLLKVVLLVLLAAYLASGTFMVQEGEQGVRLRFGQIVGDPEPTVYDSGWHFGLPYPIEQNITVPTGSQALNMTNVYWGKRQERARRGGLNPVEDGYLVTGDAGIVHARFQIDYQISDPVQFVRHVEGLTGSSDQSLASAQQLVRSVAEQGIIHAVAQTPADTVIGGNANTGLAQAHMQRLLDAMNSGIAIQSVSMDDQSMPSSVEQAYQAVTNAESNKAQQIEEARQRRAEILSSAAGAAGLPLANQETGPLLDLLEQYQAAVRREDQTSAEQLRAQWAKAFNDLQMTITQADQPTQTVRIGGEAASIINEARSYSYEIEQAVQTERDTFRSLLAQYEKHPQILVNRLWQDTREQILTGDGVETIYSMEGRPYIVTNRDPEVARQRQEQQMQRASEANQQQ